MPTALALRAPGPVRGVIERLLRDNVAAYTDRSTPSGCFVVLGALNVTPATEHLSAFLTELRDADRRSIRARLDAAASAGESIPECGTATMAHYLVTVLHGLSVQARDGATAAELNDVVDVALAAWDTLAASPH